MSGPQQSYWPLLVQRMRNATVYSVEQEAEDWVMVRVPLPDGRSQRSLVRVGRMPRIPEHEWITIDSFVGEAGRINPWHALQITEDYVCGSPALYNDLLSFRHAFVLKGGPQDAVDLLEVSLMIVSSTADELERKLLGQDVH